MKCHMRGCEEMAMSGAPVCEKHLDHRCTKRCLRKSGGTYYCNDVEPVVVTLRRTDG